MRVLITGFAGFIGSNLTRKILAQTSKDDHVVGIDAYTYAARPDWAIKAFDPEKNTFTERRLDLRMPGLIEDFIEEFQPDQVYHLAAESHVCRSIEGPRAFAESNYMGTFNLLEGLRKIGFKGKLVHVSTDEAFGQLTLKERAFTEETPIDPTSPYAASKAASDLMVRSYVHTYGMNAVITRCTNNYGPNQHYEKLIPKAIISALQDEELTVYGSGEQVREWIHVDDHCDALITCMKEGRSGEVYCIGSGLELSNLEVIQMVSRAMNKKIIVRHTNDRPTDDFRYAVETNKLRRLGWEPCSSQAYFFGKLHETAQWYRSEK